MVFQAYQMVFEAVQMVIPPAANLIRRDFFKGIEGFHRSLRLLLPPYYHPSCFDLLDFYESVLIHHRCRRGVAFDLDSQFEVGFDLSCGPGFSDREHFECPG